MLSGHFDGNGHLQTNRLQYQTCHITSKHHITSVATIFVSVCVGGKGEHIL